MRCLPSPALYPASISLPSRPDLRYAKKPADLIKERSDGAFVSQVLPKQEPPGREPGCLTDGTCMAPA